MKSNLFSIGYGNRQIEEFLSILEKFEIKTVIDVRSFPYSKFRPTYNKSQLQRTLAEKQIEYIYKGDELGGMPKDDSFYTSGEVDYDKVRNSHLYQQGLQFVKQVLNHDINVVIMCAEFDYKKCHRWNLIGMDLSKEGYSMKHITKNVEVEICNQLL